MKLNVSCVNEVELLIEVILLNEVGLQNERQRDEDHQSQQLRPDLQKECSRH